MNMRILIIDNYDSFTYNLYQNVGELLSAKLSTNEFDITVKRNDAISLDAIKAYRPDRIIISPGPGTPADSEYFGVCAETILEMGENTPLLGVCLGMQGIAHCFGGVISFAKKPMHGKVSLIKHDEQGVYQTMPQYLEVMRYHSLIVEPDSLPEYLSITSVISDDQSCSKSIDTLVEEGAEIMGIRHNSYPIEGIQFHPESFATEGGSKLLSNFLNI